ncbi:MAG: glucose-6-phosphate isomerase [Deltaproteobacteria bacterium]|nr:glucose-6-phosphate isomerase [Deltaproteobacteria bacterium]
MNHIELWERYKKYLNVNPDLGLMIDFSRMNFPEDYFDAMEPRIQKAFGDMDALESGVIANPDEKRMVGHYWLRSPALAPNLEMRHEIEETLHSIKDFARKVHTGKIKAPNGSPFSRLLIIGIGGSALGPQFVSRALGTSKDPMKPYFFDNTDPDGMDLVLEEIGDGISETLTLVISKSGKTIETRNGMLEAKAAYESRGLPFGKYAVAITGADSDLDHVAKKDKWLARFPMWDWVGGRTSETSAVGLLPAALQGIDIDSLLEGARLCDEITRKKETRSNPAALLSLLWYYGTGGRGRKDMVILPYKDRLQLFAKYLQQLVMESLGKERDLDGRMVNQGISVYGSKGSTDQHAYIQQLREGVNNFFVTFIEVLKDRDGPSLQVDPDVTSGDYLSGFLQGTRRALSEKGRESITITLEEVNARSLGGLIALYERAVGFYASLINVNAYHQPGVEAGKKAAGLVIQLQSAALSYLRKEKGRSFTSEEIASAIGKPEEAETVFKLLEHAAANKGHCIKKMPGPSPFDARYQYVSDVVSQK